MQIDPMTHVGDQMWVNHVGDPCGPPKKLMNTHTIQKTAQQAHHWFPVAVLPFFCSGWTHMQYPMKKTISGKKHKMIITVATAPMPTPIFVRLSQNALSAPLQSADFDEDEDVDEDEEDELEDENRHTPLPPPCAPVYSSGQVEHCGYMLQLDFDVAPP